MIHQNDAMMVEIMNAAGVSNPGIALLRRIRERNAVHPYEITDEWRRLDFYRRLADSGRIGRDDHAPSLTKLCDLPRWLNFAGGQCAQLPEYTG